MIKIITNFIMILINLVVYMKENVQKLRLLESRIWLELKLGTWKHDEHMQGLKQNTSVHYRPGYKCENQFTIYKMNTKASFQAYDMKHIAYIICCISSLAILRPNQRILLSALTFWALYENWCKTNETFWYLGTYLPRLSSEKIRFITKIKADKDSDW